LALASPSTVADSIDTGAAPGSGTFVCIRCGSHLSLLQDEQLPSCPRCNSSSFHRDSIFESMQEHTETTIEFALTNTPRAPSWLGVARAKLPARGRYLACRDDGEIVVFPIERGWTRIGRSAAADFRLDDPSVSRRHALIVSEPGEPLRVLDDRSLNGVFVNRELVEWGTLEDGDELAIGRYQLFALEA
jgi:hypothetical protein